MSVTQKATGYVLRRKALPGKDSVITIFTKDFGKRVFFAKGVRTAASKRAAHLQTGNLLQVLFSNSSSLSLLKQTALVSGFSLIKDNFHRVQYLYVVCFILDRLLPEEQPEEEVYNQFTKLMNYLARVEQTSFRTQVVYGSIAAMTRTLGYEPRYTDERLISFIEELIDEKVPVHDII